MDPQADKAAGLALPQNPGPQAAVPLPAQQDSHDDSIVMTVASEAASKDDTDKIDEEWVRKAKAIVEQTKSDPYLESNEISKAKADYLRLRFNKHIKIAEDRQK